MNRLAVLALLLAFSSTATAFVPAHRRISFASSRSVASSVSTTTNAESAAVKSSDNGLTPEYQAALDKALGAVKAALQDTAPHMLPGLIHFCQEYATATQASHMKTGDDATTPMAMLQRISAGVQFGFQYGMGPDKYTFGVTHQALRGKNPELEDGNTLDYYKWGCEFFRYFMDWDESLVLGQDNLKKAVEQAQAGENVIFLANHQSEADPQVVSVMFEKAGFADAAAEMVYVAGHKVTTDALAIPFSMGRNLICIHSKKHIDADPDTKPIKSRQNLAAMSGMLDKLKKGGCLLWVAPSGGRDRRDVASGKTPIAPFDSKTIDMFRLMGNKSKKPTHYYPMAMVSYELCPPPDFVEAGVGEQRNFRFVPVGIKIGDELVSEGGLDKRHEFTDNAIKQTESDYYELREALFPGTAPELQASATTTTAEVVVVSEE
jgi:glycerol-3-phosphate O-acyltransferase